MSEYPSRHRAVTKQRGIGPTVIAARALLDGASALASYHRGDHLRQPKPWIGRVTRTWTVGLTAFMCGVRREQLSIYRRECPGCGHRDQVIDWATQAVEGHALIETENVHERVWSCAP